MYIPASRYRRHPSGVVNGSTLQDAHPTLVKCALLLHLGVAAAAVVAFGMWSLVAAVHGAWLAVVAIALGGSAACILWLGAGNVLDRGARSRARRTDHEAIFAAIQKRLLSHPAGR